MLLSLAGVDQSTFLQFQAARSVVFFWLSRGFSQLFLMQLFGCGASVGVLGFTLSALVLCPALIVGFLSGFSFFLFLIPLEMGVIRGFR
jgi:hypothetical protein